MILEILGWLAVSAILFAPALSLCTGLLDACTIFTDDFATDRTGTDYTIVSGSFTVSAGVITTTSTGSVIVENTAGSTGHARAQASCKVGTATGSVRVIGSYVDSSNYLYAELVVNGASSTFKLFKKVAGVDTQLGNTQTFTASTGTFYPVCVSWDGTYATGLTTTDQTRIIRKAYTGTGNQAGFGGSAAGGTLTFDDFIFNKNRIDDSTCATCGGNNCGGCTSPYDGGFEFNVAGITDGASPPCCSGFNGLYIMPSQEDASGNYTSCAATITVTDACFGGTTDIKWSFPGALHLSCPAIGGTYFTGDIASARDCHTYNANSMSVGSAGTCSALIGSATITVTSI